MENTIENKAKLFAQYWGQEVHRVDSNNQLWKIDYDSMVHLDETDWLKLKPLSSITDEDAIKVANIFGIINYPWRPRMRYVGKEFAQLYYVNENEEGGESGMGNWKIVGNFSSDGIHVLKSNNDLVYLRAFDSLRSKGYALPYMVLSVEKQVEYGWIKLVE